MVPHGLHVALIGYTLAPDATLGGIVQEVRNAIAYLKANAADRPSPGYHGPRGVMQWVPGTASAQLLLNPIRLPKIGVSSYSNLH